MYRTTFTSALALALASRTTALTLLENSDVSPNCASVCTNIVTESDNCERKFDNVDNSDQQEQACLCNAQGMNTAIPECEACQRQYYSQNDHYDDIQTILSFCGFSSISATGSMTAMGSAPTGGSTTVITSTYTETYDDDNDTDHLETRTFTSVLPVGGAATTSPTDLASNASDVVATATGGAGGVVSSATGGAGSAVSTAGGAAGSAASSATDAAVSAAQQSGNFAPAITAAPVLAMAGVAAAVFAL